MLGALMEGSERPLKLIHLWLLPPVTLVRVMPLLCWMSDQRSTPWPMAALTPAQQRKRRVGALKTNSSIMRNMLMVAIFACFGGASVLAAVHVARCAWTSGNVRPNESPKAFSAQESAWSILCGPPLLLADWSSIKAANSHSDGVNGPNLRAAMVQM